MSLARFFRRNPHAGLARNLHEELVGQARQPAFYAVLGAPDTVDGRFDLLALHLYLAMRRLEREPEAAALNQALFDEAFGHLDVAVREMGAQDIGVGRRVKRMAEGFHGRSKALEEALGRDDAALRECLRRNVYGKVEPEEARLTQLAVYVRETDRLIQALPWADIAGGRVRFAPLPTA